MIDLTGKRCVITGGANGIGEETAKLFQKLGADVLIIDIDERKGRQLVNNTESGKIAFKRVDLGNRSDILMATEEMDSIPEKVDVLINNAAYFNRYGVLDISAEEWDKTLEVNLTAPFLLSRWAASNMIGRGKGGKIINVSAVQALLPLESSFAYASTKGGLISLSKSLAVDLAHYGILVAAVLPGPIFSTDMESNLYSEDEIRSIDERAATLIGRMGRKSEVAKLLAFLSSDDNSFMTGNCIVIDGGRLISRKQDPREVIKQGFDGQRK